MPKRKTCGVCGAPLKLVRVPVVEGRDGKTAVRLQRFPVLGCEAGHERWEAYPDFNPEIIDALFASQSRLFGVRRGVMRRRECCSRCGASLKGAPPAGQVVRTEVKTRPGIDFSIEIEGPQVECLRCRAVQIKTTDSETIVDAIGDGLSRAGIKR